jgi:N-acetylglucosamine kinase-like BadF-type ATPase
MLHSFYSPDWPRARVADLARTVSRIAEEGDPIALRLLHQAAQELALLAGSVRRQLWNEGDAGGEASPVLVSWAGGVFESSSLRERFQMLMALEKNAVCEPPRYGPAEGALLLAWQATGLNIVLKLPSAR